MAIPLETTAPIRYSRPNKRVVLSSSVDLDFTGETRLGSKVLEAYAHTSGALPGTVTQFPLIHSPLTRQFPPLGTEPAIAHRNPNPQISLEQLQLARHGAPTIREPGGTQPSRGVAQQPESQLPLEVQGQQSSSGVTVQFPEAALAGLRIERLVMKGTAAAARPAR